jgi:anti-sigma B factor antagonist
MGRAKTGRSATGHSVHPEDLLSVQIEQEGGSVQVRALGELDLLTVPMLEACMRHALEGDARSITLDLTGVTFIDSSGLLVLLSAAQTSTDDEDRLRIRCGHGAVRRVVEICAAERRLPLVD